MRPILTEVVQRGLLAAAEPLGLERPVGLEILDKMVSLLRLMLPLTLFILIGLVIHWYFVGNERIRRMERRLDWLEDQLLESEEQQNRWLRPSSDQTELPPDDEVS